jgi:hypothetical protein
MADHITVDCATQHIQRNAETPEEESARMAAAKSPQPTTADKLANIGLTVSELKAAING